MSRTAELSGSRRYFVVKVRVSARAPADDERALKCPRRVRAVVRRRPRDVRLHAVVRREPQGERAIGNDAAHRVGDDVNGVIARGNGPDGVAQLRRVRVHRAERVVRAEILTERTTS